MDIDFFKELSKIAVKKSIPKIHFTGGEPLLDSRVAEYIKTVCQHGALDVGLTTNGTLLDSYASKLYIAGLRRVNVSIPSLQTKRYQMICGHNNLRKVLDNIDIALAEGLKPVKINVPIYHDNVNELPDFMRYFLPKEDIILRFFSILPNEGISANNIVPFKEIVDTLDKSITQLPSQLKRVALTKVYLRPPYQSNARICSSCVNKNFCIDQAKSIRVSRDGIVRLCIDNPKYEKQVNSLSCLDNVISKLMDLYYI